MELTILDQCLMCILVLQLTLTSCIAQNPVRDSNYFRFAMTSKFLQILNFQTNFITDENIP